MEKIKSTFQMLTYNWRVLTGFEIIYKMASLAIFFPTFRWLFNRVMGISGYEYITRENAVSFLRHPLSFIGIFFILIVMTAVSLFDMAAVIYILDQSKQQKRVTLWSSFCYSFRTGLRVLSPRNLLLLLVLLVWIPYLHVGVASSLITTISIPEYLQVAIQKNQKFLWLSSLITAGMFFLLMRWMYSFHYFVLEKKPFRQSRKASRHLSRGHKIKDFVTLILLQFLIYLGYLLIILFGILFLVLLRKILLAIGFSQGAIYPVISGFTRAVLLIFEAMAIPASYVAISVLFYEHKEECQEAIIHSMPLEEKNDKEKKRARKIETVVLFLSLVLCVGYFYGASRGHYQLRVEQIKSMGVTAHRGDSSSYPENTMAAFIGAFEEGADWLELDVQMSKDGEIFVMHDSNFKRTTGKDANAWELTLDEIEQLDAGSFFSEQFAGEKIPTLREVLLFSKLTGVQLNIELKPTGHETDFEKTVVDLVKEYGLEDSCVITSQFYSCVEKVKAYDEKIHTVYVMWLAYGKLQKLDAADDLSIEETFVSKSLVKRMHNAGKGVYVWTVNKEDSIYRMIDCGVDNIITDDVTLTKDCIAKSETTDLIRNMVYELLYRDFLKNS